MKKVILVLLVSLISYGSFTQIYNWSKIFDGTDFLLFDMKMDDNQNIIIVGRLFGTFNFDLEGGTYELTTSGGSDIAVARYNNKGKLSWAFNIGSASTDYVESVDVDSAGNIYICGSFYDNVVDWDPSPTGTFNRGSLGSSDIYFAKYDSSGNFAWVKTVGDLNSQEAFSIDVDKNGNLYLAGAMYGAGVLDFSFGASTGLIDPTTGGTFFTKYDTDGNFIWAKNINPGNALYSVKIIGDNNENIYLQGLFNISGNDFDPSASVASLSNSGSDNDVYLAKYNSSGTYLWSKDMGSGSSHAKGIAIDYKNNIYCTGEFYSSTNIDGGGTLNSNGEKDIFLVKYNASGTYKWKLNFGTDSLNDYLYDLEIENGNIYMCGQFHDTLIYNSDTLFPGNPYNLFFAKFDTSGNYKWMHGLKDDDRTCATDFCVNNEGKLVLYGRFKESCDLNPFSDIDEFTGEPGPAYTYFISDYYMNPLFDLQPDNAEICDGQDTSFTVDAEGEEPISYQWQVNTGSSWANLSDNSIYSGSTTNTLSLSIPPLGYDGYLYRCIAGNDYPDDTSNEATLTINPLPPLDLGSDITICKGDTHTLDAGPGYAYFWNDTSTNQTFDVDTSGIFSVTITDANNCKNSDTVESAIRIPYPDAEICLVTIDTATWHNLIIWERTPGEHIESYNVYKETATDIYSLIGNVPFNSMSVFLDTTSKPKERSYKYKISVVDSCGGKESELSPYHKTMNISIANGYGTPAAQLFVYTYEVEGGGFIPSNYYIYRGIDSLNLTRYDSVPHTPVSFNYNFTDATAEYFQVVFDRNPACVPTSSAKASSGPYSQSLSNLEDNGIISGVLSINEVIDDILVYPNPFSAYTRVFIPERGNYILRIKDISGKVLQMKKIENTASGQINRGNLKPGIYFIELTGKKSYKAKIVIFD